MIKSNDNIYSLINPLYPDLINKVKNLIKKSEQQYSGQQNYETAGFLWDHTFQVASLSYKLSVLEKKDPVIPVITALFHDTGKFYQGEYHQDEIPEEEKAAELADEILTKAAMPKKQIDIVINGIIALYNEEIADNFESDIVHDADFLAKSGYTGVANFFIKSALRNKPLRKAVLESLSKEMTYASCLPDNMRTSTGQILAKKKSQDSLIFYYALLDDLSESQIAFYQVKKNNLLYHPDSPKEIEVFMVIPDKCQKCGAKLQLDFSRENGVKCKKLLGNISCEACGNHYQHSFCLPEISALLPK